MDIATFLGGALAVGLMYFELTHDNLLGIFANQRAISLVFGGTLAAVLMSCRGGQLLRALGSLLQFVFPRSLPGEKDVIGWMTRLAEQTGRQGFNSMQAPAEADAFLKFAVKAALEKPDERHLRQVLEDALLEEEKRHSDISGVFLTMASVAPLFGLLGTLMGMVGMLKGITNAKSIGPAMAVAITATFYGVGLAVLFATPVANKLKANSLRERRLHEIVTAGMLDIVGGAIPLEVERHLQAFMETGKRP
ncbi:MAG: MotA/TolQ/ExbB proton channel family protein [Elusimicrobiota bacterium]